MEISNEDMQRAYEGMMALNEQLGEQKEFLEAMEKMTFSELTPERWAMIVGNIPSFKNSIDLLMVSARASGIMDHDPAQVAEMGERIKESGIEIPEFLRNPE